MGSIEGIHHVSLTVADVDRSISFYKRFGLEVQSRADTSGPDVEEGTGVPGAQLDEAFLSGANVLLELIKYNEMKSGQAPANNTIGSAHVCFRVRNMPEVYNDLRNAGVEFISAPHRQGKLDWVYLKDPDGITVELLEELD
jgi:catechol 2,3-dioxygenase-like lactoylglutathione lyase family enzyme